MKRVEHFLFDRSRDPLLKEVFQRKKHRQNGWSARQEACGCRLVILLAIRQVESFGTCMSRRLTTLLPAITLAVAIDTTRIHRVAGRTSDRTALVTTCPRLAPTAPSPMWV
jgi:hypothetical protein